MWHALIKLYFVKLANFRLLNFLLLTLGACCFYCLFNVSSIVVRQLLNWIIKKMDIKVEGQFCCFRKKKRYMGLGLRPPRGIIILIKYIFVNYTFITVVIEVGLLNRKFQVIASFY